MGTLGKKTKGKAQSKVVMCESWCIVRNAFRDEETLYVVNSMHITVAGLDHWSSAMLVVLCAHKCTNAITCNSSKNKWRHGSYRGGLVHGF